MYNKLIELGAPSEKLILNTYGPNEEYFEISPNFSQKRIIALGRFVVKKLLITPFWPLGKY